MRRGVLLLVLVAFVLAAGACGGDGDNGGDGGTAGTAGNTTSGERLSQDEFVEQVNDICSETISKIEAIQYPGSIAALAEPVEQAKETLDEGIAELKQLEPPSTVEDDFQEFIEVNERQSASLADLADAARAGDAQRVTEILTEREADIRRSNRLARQMGATECASA